MHSVRVEDTISCGVQDLSHTKCFTRSCNHSHSIAARPHRPADQLVQKDGRLIELRQAHPQHAVLGQPAGLRRIAEDRPSLYRLIGDRAIGRPARPVIESFDELLRGQRSLRRLVQRILGPLELFVRLLVERELPSALV